MSHAFSTKISVHKHYKIDCIPEKIIVSEVPVLVEPRFDFRIFRVIVLAPGRRTLRSRRRQGSDPKQFSTTTTGLYSHSQVLSTTSSGWQPCNERTQQRRYNIRMMYLHLSFLCREVAISELCISSTVFVSV